MCQKEFTSARQSGSALCKIIQTAPQPASQVQAGVRLFVSITTLRQNCASKQVQHREKWQTCTQQSPETTPSSLAESHCFEVHCLMIHVICIALHRLSLAYMSHLDRYVYMTILLCFQAGQVLSRQPQTDWMIISEARKWSPTTSRSWVIKKVHPCLPLSKEWPDKNPGNQQTLRQYTAASLKGALNVCSNHAGVTIPHLVTSCLQNYFVIGFLSAQRKSAH